jgi:hypothetical protein
MNEPKLSALDPKKKADVIWNRTALFMHDWLRVCDLGGWCSVRFDYTLAELETARIEQIAQVFAPEGPGARKPNPKWDGKLTG